MVMNIKIKTETCLAALIRRKSPAQLGSKRALPHTTFTAQHENFALYARHAISD
jgi:hypothetical protein